MPSQFHLFYDVIVHVMLFHRNFLQDSDVLFDADELLIFYHPQNVFSRFTIISKKIEKSLSVYMEFRLS
ncbi:MAG: hypothetical protein CK425_02025 [Parachlamydia sp.]|nr:MAG: hypothetical protein CK425_02025 [Parachlamydia sp.]